MASSQVHIENLNVFFELKHHENSLPWYLYLHKIKFIAGWGAEKRDLKQCPANVILLIFSLDDTGESF